MNLIYVDTDDFGINIDRGDDGGLAISIDSRQGYIASLTADSERAIRAGDLFTALRHKVQSSRGVVHPLLGVAYADAVAEANQGSDAQFSRVAMLRAFHKIVNDHNEAVRVRVKVGDMTRLDPNWWALYRDPEGEL